MKINNPSIYITSKQIMLSRTWSTQSETLEGFQPVVIFRSNSLALIEKGRLGAIISTIRAKKYSHAIKEKEGAGETNLL